MRILDKYILKKYLITFVFILLILIPVIIAIDTGEKIDKFLRHTDLTLAMIISDYYVNFIINIGNMILPLALFVSVLFFTSKLAGNVEIIAISSAKISFTRFLYPYFIGATLVTSLSLALNHFVVPKSSKEFLKFTMKYLKNIDVSDKNLSNVNLQLSDTEYIYMKSFNVGRGVGIDFCYEIYDGTELVEKHIGDRITYIEQDSLYRMTNYYKRILGGDSDSIFYAKRFKKHFNFFPKDLEHVSTFAKEMQTPELLDYIELSKSRGRGDLNVYYVELYKRTSLPIAAYILTLIAVCLGSVKRRGGIGMNLAIGITLAFVYVFLLKIVEVIGASPNSNPMLLVWIPNILFGSVGVYLYMKVKG